MCMHARGVWRHAPQEIFSKFDVLRLILRPFWDRSRAVVATWLAEYIAPTFWLSMYIFILLIQLTSNFTREGTKLGRTAGGVEWKPLQYIEGRKCLLTQLYSYTILLIKFGLWTSVLQYLHSMWLSVYIIASSGFTICFSIHGVQHGHTNVGVYFCTVIVLTNWLIHSTSVCVCMCFQAVVAWLYYQYI